MMIARNCVQRSIESRPSGTRAVLRHSQLFRKDTGIMKKELLHPEITIYLEVGNGKNKERSTLVDRWKMQINKKIVGIDA